MHSMKYNQSISFISSHPYLKKGFDKLKKSEIDIFVGFFDIDYSDKSNAMQACNRMFMDKSEKPKNWTTIMELVSSVISHHYSQK